MKAKFIFILFLMLPASPSKANSLDTSSGLFSFVAFEGLVFAHSWLLTKSPKEYGLATGLLYPLTGLETSKDAAFWTSLAAAEGMNIYNLNMENKGFSDKEMLKRNFIGWNLVFGITVASQFVFKGGKQNKGVSLNALSFAPTESGGELRIDLRF